MRTILVCCLLLLNACAERVVLRLPDSSRPLTPVEVEGVFKGLETQAATVHTFKGLARAVLEQGREKVALRYAFVYSSPGNLRIEVLPLGAAYALSILLVKDGHATLLDLQDSKAYQSESAEALLRRFLQVPLNERDMAALVLGHLPPGALAELRASKTLEAAQDPATAVVYLNDQRLGLSFEIEPLSNLVRKATYLSRYNETVQLEMNGSGATDVSGTLLWNRVELSAPGFPMKTSFRFSSQNVNDPLRDDVFSIAIPSEYEVVKVGMSQD